MAHIGVVGADLRVRPVHERVLTRANLRVRPYSIRTSQHDVDHATRLVTHHAVRASKAVARLRKRAVSIAWNVQKRLAGW
jgi:hypothetical protein